MKLSGRLLVASPQLLDPNFHRTVVLVLDHNDDGAFGVVLNRLLPVEVDAVLPGWQDVVSRPDGLFQGGPVGLDGAIGVAIASAPPLGPAGRSTDPDLALGSEPDDERDHGSLVDPARLRGASSDVPDDHLVDRFTGAFGLVDLDADPTTVVGRFSGLRIFAGHAGWGGGQLEEEIDEGAWYVVPSEPDDVFTADPETLWTRVLHRQGGDLAMLAHYPPDLRLN